MNDEIFVIVSIQPFFNVIFLEETIFLRPIVAEATEWTDVPEPFLKGQAIDTNRDARWCFKLM